MRSSSDAGSTPAISTLQNPQVHINNGLADFLFCMPTQMSTEIGALCTQNEAVNNIRKVWEE
ncbi:MAG: hypothetical protein ACLFQX_05365 [Candidatus Kapaibacterium sp.]